MNPLSLIQTFLEGLAAFVSPCILPTLPVYLVYLTGGDYPEDDQKSRWRRRVIHTLAFILGFTLLFVAMGAGATAIGKLLQRHQALLDKIGGIVLVIFGLHYMGAIKIPLLNRHIKAEYNPEGMRFFSAMLFGAAFSLGWSACTGPMLGAALLQASGTRSIWKGMAMLFTYSMGLGIPFFLLALLYEKMRGVLNFLKRNAQVISIISGCLLILTGIAMFFGLIAYFNALFY